MRPSISLLAFMTLVSGYTFSDYREMASTSKPPDEGPHDWEQHKEIIRNLYIVKNLTLQRLIQEMKTAHAFNATYASQHLNHMT